MSTSADQIQIFYEISMSLGLTLDLRKMVKTALSAYLKKLNCGAGSVLQFSAIPGEKISLNKVYSIPRNFDKVENYEKMIKTILPQDYPVDQAKLLQIFPKKYQSESGKNIIIMSLHGFGLLVLAKGGDSFDDYILNSVRQLNLKFAQACRACVQNEALQKSEEKYRSIFNSIQDVYAEVDAASGVILEISPSIKQISGFSREDMLGRNINDFYARQEQRLELINLLYKNGSVSDYEVSLINKTGRERIVSFSVSLVRNEAHEPYKVVGNMRDVTERKLVHQQLIRNEENQRIINYFATSIAGANTVNEILWDITYNCISRMELEDCVIYLFNDDRSKLVQSAAFGSSKEKDYKILNPIEIPVGKGIVGHVAKTGKAEIIDDVSLDDRYIFDDKARGSELTVPIVYENQVIGIVDSEHTRKNFFREHHLQILEAISSLAANKIMRSISMKKTEESENLKSAILFSSLDSLILMDHQGKIIEFNPAAEKTFGFNRDEIIGKVLSETLVPHRMRSAHSEGLKKYIKTGHGPVLGKRFEISALRASGEEFPIEIAITPIKKGDHPIFTAFIRDISERLAAEDQMQLQAATLEAAANGIVITDIQGKILWANSAMEELTGYSKSEIIGKNPRIFKSGRHNKTFYKHMWDTILSGKVWQGEIINQYKDGRLFTEETTITPVLHDDKSISNFIAIKQDITKRKKAEAILKESDRLKTNFVSNVSHELRTPMASIMGFAGTIIRDKNMDDETKSEFIKIVFEESQRLSRLIENVLDIARIESGNINLKKQPTQLNSLIQEVVETQIVLARKKDIQLLSDIADNIPEIMATPDAIKQIAVNLISNAIKFTEPGGKVEVLLSFKTKEISFIVKDSGIGIPEADLERIFEKFYRVQRAKREDQGTGLGLAIVKEIIELHDGVITVKSKIGEGSVFEVLLPLAKS